MLLAYTAINMASSQKADMKKLIAQMWCSTAWGIYMKVKKGCDSDSPFFMRVWSFPCLAMYLVVMD